MITQVEIAHRVGLDVSSVNKILNKRQGPVFRKETVKKVFKIALQLGYDFGRLKYQHRRRHTRLARPTLVMLLVGFAAGPVSAVWLRGWDPFRTAHAWVALTAIGLFLAAGVLGHRLERGISRALDTHALLGLLAVLAAAAAFGTGFVLLP